MIDLKVLERVNKEVNSDIEYVKESPNRDIWQSPLETIELGEGDCEDFAILKWFLIDQALPDAVCSLCMVGATTRTAAHVVLLVSVLHKPWWKLWGKPTPHTFVLDNLHDNVWQLKHSDYRDMDKHYLYSRWFIERD